MIRTVEFRPAFHKIHEDPNKNYGVHGVEIVFTLRGCKGAVSFRLFTDWMLPETIAWWASKGLPGTKFKWPQSAGLAYHSMAPMYEGHTLYSNECEFLGGKPCYADSRGTDEPRDILMTEGSDGLWKWMESEYKVRWP